jgi:hypothetical protein
VCLIVCDLDSKAAVDETWAVDPQQNVGGSSSTAESKYFRQINNLEGIVSTKWLPKGWLI